MAGRGVSVVRLLTRRLGEATVELYAPQGRAPGGGWPLQRPRGQGAAVGSRAGGIALLKETHPADGVGPTAAFVVRGC